MAEESDDRTEAPTDRRRTEAREEGRVAKSSDLAGAALMLCAAIGILSLFPDVAREMAGLVRTAFAAVVLRADPGWGLSFCEAMLTAWWRMVFPLLSLTGLVVLGTHLVQVGFLLSPTALQPKFNRINPWAGAQRIVSVQAVAKLGVSLGKLSLLTAVTSLFVSSLLPQFLGLSELPAGAIIVAIHESSMQLAFALAAVLLILAFLDYGFQFWKHERDLRMTKQEIRDEMKSMDGDPQLRARRREAHRKLASSQEMQAVKTADVVVTNPTHYAVALKYDPGKMAAPVVVAKGVDEMALQIRRIAVEHAVPVVERPPLARQLYRDVRVGGAIPVDLYEALAELLHYVYRITAQYAADVLGRWSEETLMASEASHDDG